MFDVVLWQHIDRLKNKFLNGGLELMFNTLFQAFAD